MGSTSREDIPGTKWPRHLCSARANVPSHISGVLCALNPATMNAQFARVAPLSARSQAALSSAWNLGDAFLAMYTLGSKGMRAPDEIVLHRGGQIPGTVGSALKRLHNTDELAQTLLELRSSA